MWTRSWTPRFPGWTRSATNATAWCPPSPRRARRRPSGGWTRPMRTQPASTGWRRARRSGRPCRTSPSWTSPPRTAAVSAAPPRTLRVLHSTSFPLTVPAPAGGGRSSSSSTASCRTDATNWRHWRPARSGNASWTSPGCSRPPSRATWGRRPRSPGQRRAPPCWPAWVTRPNWPSSAPPPAGPRRGSWRPGCWTGSAITAAGTCAPCRPTLGERWPSPLRSCWAPCRPRPRSRGRSASSVHQTWRSAGGASITPTGDASGSAPS